MKAIQVALAAVLPWAAVCWAFLPHSRSHSAIDCGRLKQLEQFAARLPTAQVDANGILNLDPPECFHGHLCDDGRIYVREAYKQLYDKAKNITRVGEPGSPRAGKVLITGSEGIGKSACLWYFLWRLRAEGRPVLVQLGAEAYFFGADGTIVAFGEDSARMGTFYGDPDCWCLTDPAAEARKGHGCGVTVAFMALDAKYFSSFMSINFGYAKQLYMTVWSEAEIEHCRRHLPRFQHLSRKLVQRRFAEWGGLVLYVLVHAGNYYLQQRLQSACGNAAYYGVRTAAVTATPEPRERDYLSDLVFHMEVEDDLKMYHLKWASDHVKRLVLSQIKQTPEELIADMNGAARDPSGRELS
ncbi:hypothetical protein JKP88DRAFT_282860 [Tribonema minus]|uniref:Uncharacterized protein n=1 Tax=Tribonema minus TaxID=303371 RepID=A0A836C916_9STRA|nr:hypothetical protein JKP88DRAFT_282860 [Tribonema minus]